MDRKGWSLPRPEHHQEFETLCRDLMAARLRVDISLHGRNGQTQDGIDFVADTAPGPSGFQCKCVESLTIATIRAEVAKADAFRPKLHDYTVMAAIDRDVQLQSAVLELSQNRQAKGQFPVRLIPWPEIQDRLAEHLQVLRSHYPDLAPRLHDLLAGAMRRLDRDHAGATLDISLAPGQTNITVKPGATPIPFSTTLRGERARARFEEAIRTGSEVEFAASEFDARLPDALYDLVAGLRPRSLTLRPVNLARDMAVALVIEPSDRWRSYAHFERSVQRGRLPGIPSTMRTVPPGEALEAFEVVPTLLPMAVSVHRTSERDGRTSIDRRYAGASVEAAAGVEEVLATVQSGAYLAVIGPDFTICVQIPPNPIDTDTLMPELVRIADELASVTGWDLHFGESPNIEDFRISAALLPLLRDRRVDHQPGGEILWTVRDEDDRDRVVNLFESGSSPYTIRFNQTLEVEVFGFSAELPTALTCTIDGDQLMLREALRGTLPVQLRIPIKHAVEELVPDDGAAQ